LFGGNALGLRLPIQPIDLGGLLLTQLQKLGDLGLQRAGLLLVAILERAYLGVCQLAH